MKRHLCAMNVDDGKDNITNYVLLSVNKCLQEQQQYHEKGINKSGFVEYLYPYLLLFIISIFFPYAILFSYSIFTV